jgi:hypothetical protein
MGNPLPDDFKSFHAEFAEAMLLGQCIPFHLFDLEGIVRAVDECRYDFGKPLRFVRFGRYFNATDSYFGLWQPKDGNGEWKVISAYHSRDEEIDELLLSTLKANPESTVYASFSDWLDQWFAEDGIPVTYGCRTNGLVRNWNPADPQPTYSPGYLDYERRWIYT